MKRRAAGAALVVLLATVGTAHLAFRAFQPPVFLWGDELHYLELARLDRLSGEMSLLPGRLRYSHRPELQSRIAAQFADDIHSESELRPHSLRPGRDLLRRLSLFQLILLLTTIALVFFLGRACGLGRAAAVQSAALVGLSPALGFHVHSLWPEVLHSLLLVIALLGLVRSVEGGSSGGLVASGVATGMAILAKGVVGPFVPCVVVGLVASGISASVDGTGFRRSWRSVAPALLWLAAVTIVLTPQLVSNARQGFGPRLSANAWWNLELGLTISPSDLATASQTRPRALVRSNQAYRSASSEPTERERLARQRTLEALAARPALDVAVSQAKKLADLLLHGQSSLDESLGPRHRWGDVPQPILARLARWGRVELDLLLILGMLGWLVSLRALRRWWPVSSFAAYYSLVLLAIPIKGRFLLPLLPVLSVLASLAIEETLKQSRLQRSGRLVRRTGDGRRPRPGGGGEDDAAQRIADRRPISIQVGDDGVAVFP